MHKSSRVNSWLVGALAWLCLIAVSEQAVAKEVPQVLPRTDDSFVEHVKPIKVWVMLGQSSVLGFGRVGPKEMQGALAYLVHERGLCSQLVDGAGSRLARRDVRYVHVMDQRGAEYKDLERFGVVRSDWLAPNKAFGPEFGFVQVMGYCHAEPVFLLKACISNRNLGWGLLPPVSEPSGRAMANLLEPVGP